MKTTIVHVPKDMPGHSVMSKTLQAIARAFAEERDGMDAEPNQDDIDRAARFSQVSYEYRSGDDLYLVTVAGDDKDVDHYESVLESIA